MQPTASSSALTRLHISPLTPALLSTYISPSLQSGAQNISYHTIETFPERPYGYVELPAMDAEKLKKKFNGSILKGSKVKVEEARPEKKRKADAVESEVVEKKSKKIKGGKGVLPGYELEDGRKVKRGWTEPASGKKEKKEKKVKKEKAGGRGRQAKPSKYTKQSELLFKTKVPSNKRANAEKGGHKIERNKDKYNNKKKKGKGEVVVHEFEKTTKHASFLKTNQISKDSKTVSEFVDGTGWVDAKGEIVEADLKKRLRGNSKKLLDNDAAAEPVESKDKKDDEQDDDDDDEEEEKEEKLDEKDDNSDDDSSVLSESSVVSSSSEESEDESVASDSPKKPSSTPADTKDGKLLMPVLKSALKESSPLASKEKAFFDPDLQEGFTASSVALEALYKRSGSGAGLSTPRPAPINTSFSFFSGEGDVDDENDDIAELKEPQTPFTRQDMQWRGIRSAAPTPDTTTASKRFIFPLPESEDDEDEDEDEDVEMGDDGGAEKSSDQTDAKKEGGEETEFSKWFWENRGDNNRAWKKRRREAMKVKRQRENRRLGRRVV